MGDLETAVVAESMLADWLQENKIVIAALTLGFVGLLGLQQRRKNEEQEMDDFFAKYGRDEETDDDLGENDVEDYWSRIGLERNAPWETNAFPAREESVAVLEAPQAKVVDAMFERREEEQPTKKRTSKSNNFLTAAVLCAFALLAGLAVMSPSGSAEKQAAKHVTKKIEDIQVGDRVEARNPDLAQESAEADINPATWRKIDLMMEDGSCRITLLRSLKWLEEEEAIVGGTIEMDLPELGVSGEAEVLSIGPCPPVKKGKGRVVTATYVHESGKV